MSIQAEDQCSLKMPGTGVKTPITVAHGDGIGPEIMAATLQIIQAAGAQLDIETIEIGEKMYMKGCTTGIEDSAWDSLRRTKVFLKAPITTPQGGGFKSLNVTTRKMLGLYANIRPCVSYHPFVVTKHPEMDVVIVRENEEDTYAGIEYQQSNDVVQCLKLISRQGCEKIVRYAFEYAVSHNRKKVTCFSKDNIMKMTDGLFHKVFDSIAKEYPQIENEHWIVDIGAAKLADTPEAFDVIVMANLYGDILSDVAAQIAGSVGLAGSANIGTQCAMFEAIHGSAPRRAGQNMANPSGLLHGAIMMLVHIGQTDVAETVHNAWLKTMEDGIYTYDIYKEGSSKQKVGTREFADAVCERLGQKPATLKSVTYAPKTADNGKPSVGQWVSGGVASQKSLVGTDIFIQFTPGPGNTNNAQALADLLKPCQTPELSLQIISNRGVKAWPNGFEETFCVDHWRCRFVCQNADSPTASVPPQAIVALLNKVITAGLDVGKIENLFNIDGQPAYSKDQGA